MSDNCSTEVRITESDFDAGTELNALYQRASGPLGAVATFIGLVRDQFQGERVNTLHLEHYPGMTEKSIEVIVAQAVERWPLLDVVVIHRVGTLEAHAQIVYVQVGSGHRDAAFAAAEFIMDYLKTEAVFWKREAGTGSERWVESTEEDRQRQAAWSSEPDRDGA